MTAPVDGALLLDLIERSGLLPSQTIAPFRGQPGQAGVDTARQLVGERLLTPFQARTLLAGEPSSYFVGDRYKILEHLGKGGTGQVYMGEHLLLRRVVALKVLAAEFGQEVGRADADRLFADTRAVATLEHPNVVRVYEMDASPVGPFIAMEYVDGAGLHSVVSKFGAMDVERAVDAACQAAEGLAHAHAAGLVHRDVKPGNLLLDRTGAVRVADFGLTRLRDANPNPAGVRQVGRPTGAVEFQSPEMGVGGGAADARSDVYSLGATLYFLLTGRPPFPDGSAQNKLLAHQVKAPPLASDANPAVPRGLAVAITIMLAKRAADRPQAMADVQRLLARWRPEGTRVPPAQEMPKHPPTAYRLGLCPPPTAPVVAGLPGPPGSGPTSGTFRLPESGSFPRLPSAAPVAGNAGPRSGAKAGSWVLPLPQATTHSAGRPSPWPAPTARPPGPPPAHLLLQGSGSTFIKPAMDEWVAAFQKSGGGRVKYDGIGSARGIENLLDGVLPFACTGVPVADDDLRQDRIDPAEVLHIPLALGAVVPIYTLSGVSEPLKFTGEVLADIFLGRIAKWNDAAIKVCNPAVAGQLPDLPIRVVARGDGSGTTAAWAEYLGKASPEFDRRVGRGVKAAWPVAVLEKGNGRVIRRVKETDGAIGYAEHTSAVVASVRHAAVRNQRDRYAEPSPEALAASVGGLHPLPPDLRFHAGGAAEYPLCVCAWAVTFTRPRADREVVAQLVHFLRWIVHDGQALLPNLKYAPLPQAVVAAVDAKLAGVVAG